MEQLQWEQQRTENLNRKQACGVRTEHSSIVCPQFGLTRSARKFLNRLEITVTILNRFQHRAKVCTFSLFAIDLLAIQSVLQTCGRSDHSVEESGAFLSSQRIPKLYSAEDVNQHAEGRTHRHNMVPRNSFGSKPLKLQFPIVVTEISSDDTTVLVTVMYRRGHFQGGARLLVGQLYYHGGYRYSMSQCQFFFFFSFFFLVILQTLC